MRIGIRIPFGWTNGFHPTTFPKFNSSPLKNDGWKTILSLWDGNFSGAFAVKLRGVGWMNLIMDYGIKLWYQPVPLHYFTFFSEEKTPSRRGVTLYRNISEYFGWLPTNIRPIPTSAKLLICAAGGPGLDQGLHKNPITTDHDQQFQRGWTNYRQTLRSPMAAKKLGTF